MTLTIQNSNALRFSLGICCWIQTHLGTASKSKNDNANI